MKLRNFLLIELFFLLSIDNCSSQLFDIIMKENYSPPTIKSLFQKNDYTNNDQQLLKDTCLEIQSLKKKQEILRELNSQIIKKLQSSRKLTIKHKDLGKGIISFIQQNENRMNQLKKEWEVKNIHMSKKIYAKESKLNELKNRIHDKVDAMKKQIDVLEYKIASVEMYSQSQIAKIKEGINIPEINISSKLEVESTINANRIIAKSFEAGDAKFQSDQIIFYSEDMKLLVGNEAIALKDLVKELSLVQGVENRCGADLSKCRPMSLEEMEYHQKQQENMLMEIIKLRQQIREFK